MIPKPGKTSRRPDGVTSSPADRVMAVLYLIFFTVGSVGHYVDATRPLMLRLTPLILLLFGLTALGRILVTRAWSVIIWVVATYAVTFALEAVGVATGVIFGAYEYGATLGPMVFAVPLIIGFNWVIVVLGAILITRRMLSGCSPRVLLVAGPLIVGALAVLFDLVLEPVAIRFDYWQWLSGRVPLRNYLAWFVIAGAVSLPVFRMKEPRRDPLPVYYVVVQFVFMVSLLPLAAG